MRIAEYKQIDTQIVEHQRIIPRELETGEMVEDSLCEVETYTEEIPVMGMVYRDATDEEIAQMEQEQAEMSDVEPTAEERIAELENQNAMLLECVLEMSEIIYA